MTYTPNTRSHEQRTLSLHALTGLLGLLFSLDASIYQAKLAQAEARAGLSKTEYQRAEQLWNKRLIAEYDRDKQLALVFIFLVLAAQFESLRGALFALTYTGGSLSVYSQIGLITLVGLISKHGILIGEFANQLQERGLAHRDAILEAASLRLRPILMTTGATVLGVLPLALASGAGAESRQQIGWVIAAGMCFGTLMTLFVVPAVYSYLGRQQAPVPGPETSGTAGTAGTPAPL